MTPNGRSYLLGLLIVSAAVCLVLGVSLPAIKLTRLYMWTDTHSIASVVLALFQKGEVFLCLILVVFSILFPALKLLYLLALYAVPVEPGNEKRKALERLSWLGKWSMLDVMVLALMIFYVKSSGIADAAALPGIYFFTASVLLTMWATALTHQA